ncbi:hypothetical protein FBZ94_106155 [Bradyrhizobium sacchari]|uniref:Uncharacterized protein n=1 Tax=Bradyrhizobium sacchari TaxID=1399419 RepID=A0A560ICX7_9BRAD|nr:hypothetical protein FBZ94_106155 [Bradyrhizobium sacchari]TWB71173.1 hypothetical protein FBZ95_107155 [Bradyrhizobium sacchari]
MRVAVGKMTIETYMLSSVLAGLAGIVFFYTSAGYSLARRPVAKSAGVAS